MLMEAFNFREGFVTGGGIPRGRPAHHRHADLFPLLVGQFLEPERRPACAPGLTGARKHAKQRAHNIVVNGPTFTLEDHSASKNET